MATFNGDRVRRLNDEPVREDGRYVVYWCQMSRRLSANHALGYALAWARKLNKPLVVYEGLKLNYPWASARVHQFMLEGMRDTAAAAAKLGINYWPFVETPGDPGRGLVRKVAADACLVVTDDYPQFITPAQNRAAAKVLDVAFHAIDANGVVPLAKLGAAVGGRGPPAAAAAQVVRRGVGPPGGDRTRLPGGSPHGGGAAVPALEAAGRPRQVRRVAAGRSGREARPP
jgi:deoxyribodipyrimidine photo-lyase